MLLGLIYHGRI